MRRCCVAGVSQLRELGGVPLRHAFKLFALVAFKTTIAPLEPLPHLITKCARMSAQPLDGPPGHGSKHDAVDRARRNTELTARALGGNDGVHEPWRTDDGVGRASLDTQGAADTVLFLDQRHLAGLICSARRIKRTWLMPGESCKPMDHMLTARWAAIDRREPRGDCVRVWPAALIAALPALSLWQKRVDAFRERARRRSDAQRGNKYRRERERRYRE